jgi:endonuclease/exonuclease/phosphatase family metal-dependent hydrolase
VSRPQTRLTLPTLLVLLIVVAALGLFGCGKSVQHPLVENPFIGASVGSDTTLEIVSWNLKEFPLAGDTTVDHVVDAISAVDADVVALQEITSAQRFEALLAGLEGWAGYRASSAGHSLNLAILWDTREVTVAAGGVYQYVPADVRPFPRLPLVLECRYGDTPLVIINNHLKCCGDGDLDPADPGDEETRRRDACLELQRYVEAEFAGTRVVVLGDMNDQLTDPQDDNVFWNFLAADEAYRFVDLAIAEGPPGNWSFPSWPSHLDHILITEPLFAAFADGAALVATVPLDDYLGSGVYREQVSDHLPVVVRLRI